MIFPHDDDYGTDEHFDVTLIVFKSMQEMNKNLAFTMVNTIELGSWTRITIANTTNFKSIKLQFLYGTLHYALVCRIKNVEM